MSESKSKDDLMHPIDDNEDPERLRRMQDRLRDWLNDPHTVISDISRRTSVSISTLHKFRKGLRTGNLSVRVMESLMRLRLSGIYHRRRGKVTGPERGRNVHAVTAKDETA